MEVCEESAHFIRPTAFHAAHFDAARCVLVSVVHDVSEELGTGDEGPSPAELREALQAGRQLGVALERLTHRSA